MKNEMTHGEMQIVLGRTLQHFDGKMTLDQMARAYGQECATNLEPEARCRNANGNSMFREMGQRYGGHLSIQQTSQFIADEIDVFDFPSGQ